MLVRAGVAVHVEPARIDEAEVKASLRVAGATAAQAAETLAELKAQRVARRHARALVIGADQILECDGMWFEKPSDHEQAAAHLRALRGRSHALVTAVCAVRDGARLWHHTDVARLTMRPLSDSFIAQYLDAAGEAACASVGAYQLEGLGAQLFTGIEGDHFTVLGLPLIPLLGFLREHGLVPQ